MGQLALSEDGWAVMLKDSNVGSGKPSSIKYGLKLLAKGKEQLMMPNQLEVFWASEGAIEVVKRI